MKEQDVLVFLLSLGVLLSAARLLGELARRLGFPLIFGEIASGRTAPSSAATSAADVASSRRARAAGAITAPRSESMRPRRASLADI